MQTTPAVIQLLAALAMAASAAWCAILVRLLSGRSLVPYEPRRRVPWSGLAVTAIATLYVLLSPLLAYIALRYAGIAIGPGAEEQPGYLAAVLAAATASGIVGLVLAVCFFIGIYHARAEDLGLDTRRLHYDLMVGLVAVAAVDFPLLMLQGVLTKWLPYEHPLLELIKSEPSTRTLLMGAWLAVVIAPLVEEFLFRVMIQGWLEARMRSRRSRRMFAALPVGCVPIVVSSLLFALAHASHGPAPLPLLLLGLVMGYLYHQTHRIWPSLIVHMCFNGASMALLGLSLASSP